MPKGEFVGEFELYVMLAIAHLNDEAYGVAIRQAIEDRTGRDVAIGAVYATLARLEEKRLVRYDMSDPQPVAGAKEAFASLVKDEPSIDVNIDELGETSMEYRLDSADDRALWNQVWTEVKAS